MARGVRCAWQSAVRLGWRRRDRGDQLHAPGPAGLPSGPDRVAGVSGRRWLHLTTRGELYSAAARGAIPRVVDDGELARLARFRAAHPDVTVGMGDFGIWQAVIPGDSGGETFTARHTLGELLDRLGACSGSRRHDAPGGPRRLHEAVPPDQVARWAAQATTIWPTPRDNP